MPLAAASRSNVRLTPVPTCRATARNETGERGAAMGNSSFLRTISPLSEADPSRHARRGE